MSFGSVIFFLVFFIPLVIFIIWMMRQDKRRGNIGLIVLGIMVIIGVYVVYLMNQPK